MKMNNLHAYFNILFSVLIKFILIEYEISTEFKHTIFLNKMWIRYSPR